jgi:hypothetical protein
LFPAHVVCIPDHEVVTVLTCAFMPGPVSWVLGPASKHDDVWSWDIETMAVSAFRRRAGDSESGPHEGFSIEHFDVIVVWVFEDWALFKVSFSEHLVSVLVASMDDEVVANQDSAVALSWGRFGSWGLRPYPSHELKVEDVQVIEEVLAIPASEHKHLVASNKCGSMSKPCCGGTGSVWALVPSHLDWIQSVKVSEDNVLAWSFSSKDQNSTACQYRGMAIPGLGRGSLYLWFDPSRGIEVQHMGVIEVLIAHLLVQEVVASKE